MLVVTYTNSPRTTELYPNGDLNTKPLVDNVGSALAQFYPDKIITPECQLKIALAQKMSNGVSCFVTQPLWFDPELVPDVMFIIESDDLELASEQTFVDYLLNPSEENLIESPTEGVKMAVNYIREAQIGAGVAPGAELYTSTMYILAGMLALGLVANAFVKPLSDKWSMSDEEVASLQAKTAAASAGPTGSFGIGKGGLDAKAAFAWAVVGIPLLWGVWITLRNSLAIFG